MWIVLVLALLALAVLMPTYGLAAVLRRHRSAIARERTENALKHLLRQANDGHSSSFQSLKGELGLSDSVLLALAERLEDEGLIQSDGTHLKLTTKGEQLALHVVRAHRLWEVYLAEELGMPVDRVHAAAERHEHRLSPQQVDRLSARMGHPDVDPHGDPIPTADGVMPAAPGTVLSAWPLSTPARIVHLEDEPPLAYAQLTAEGLKLGQVVRVIERTPARLVLTDGENEYRLAPMLAANVHVVAAGDAPVPVEGLIPLSRLPAGASANIVALDPSFRGFARRRLLDLGFTPGARIRSELATFTGDPRAYRLRGTTIALRREQSDRVLVKALASEGGS
jgi:DtxR family transcriptional regulator, Mn-dependent transcriptional regulator